MKRTIVVLLLGVALVVGAAVVVVPPLVVGPVYSVPRLQAGLTPRHNVWGGRTLWVRAVAVLGRDVGTYPDTVVLFDHGPLGSSPGFTVRVTRPNVAFALLSWKAWMARHLPGMRWLYGEQDGVYRVRFFRPTWCMSCPVGQLE